MNLRFSGLILAFFVASNLFSQERLTVAESSNYTQTSDYTQVIEMVEWLDEQSEFIRIEQIAETIEKRKIPMLVIAHPMIHSSKKSL